MDFKEVKSSGEKMPILQQIANIMKWDICSANVEL